MLLETQKLFLHNEDACMKELDFELVKKLFGTEDRDISILSLELAVSYPDMSCKDIFKIFKLTCDNYQEKSDNIEDPTAYFNRRFSGKSMGQIKDEFDPKANLHSTHIFRNFYRVIDSSNEWNHELKKKACLKLFQNHKEKLTELLKKNYRNTRLLDLFEVTCEFIDLIQKKVET